MSNAVVEARPDITVASANSLTMMTRPEVPLQVITPELVRASIKRARRSLEKAAAEIVWQIEMEAWRTLGYASWSAMREAEYGGAAFMVPSKNRPELVARIKAIEVGRTVRGGSKHLTDQEIADTAGVSRRQVQDDLHENNEMRRSAHIAASERASQEVDLLNQIQDLVGTTAKYAGELSVKAREHLIRILNSALSDIEQA